MLTENWKDELERIWKAIGTEPPIVLPWTKERDRFFKAVSSVVENRSESTPANCQFCRQFACACCRALSKWFVSPASLDALAVVERFAKGEASFDELVAARNAARWAARRLEKEWSTPEFESAMAVCWSATNDHREAYSRVVYAAFRAKLEASTMESICDKLRGIPLSSA